MITQAMRTLPSPHTVARLLEPWHLRYYKALPLGPLTEFDHNCIAVLDEDQRILVCTHSNQLANLRAMANACAGMFGRLQPGDVVMANDPYAGALHLQDHMLIAPLYADGQYMGQVMICGHLPDVGGESFGNYHPGATELWQEGVLTTLVRLARGGKVDQDVFMTLKLNSRVPFLLGAALETMLSALRGLVEELPSQLDPASAQDLIAESRTAMETLRARMTGPSEVVEARVHNCAAEDAVVRLQVRPSSDRFVVDFTGSSSEAAEGFINATAHTTMSAVAQTFIELAGCRANSGVLDALDVVTPGASVVDCTFPLAVGWSPHGTAGHIRQLIKAAMSPWIVLPEHRKSMPHRPVVHIVACKSAGCWF
jgi:N-methylhydantoinase B